MDHGSSSGSYGAGSVHDGARSLRVANIGLFRSRRDTRRSLGRCLSWIRRRFDCLRPRRSAFHHSAGMAQRITKGMETLSPLAGKPAPPEILVDPSKLERAYFDTRPDVEDPNQLVHFGTSGHRGSSLRASFNEPHILAITQAICDYRRMQGTMGPLYLGKDTHALSGPAQRTALEVLAANQVETLIQQNDRVTTTPVISRAILFYTPHQTTNLPDGIVVTPSHNPPEDGGFKYNPPHGGPADTVTT